MRSYSITGVLLLLLVVFSSCQRPANDGDIHTAVQQGDVETVRALLQERPDLVQAKDEAGRTALHLTDDPALIQLLVSSGADAHQQDSRGRSPLRMTLLYASRFPGLREQKKETLTAFLEADVQFPTEGEEGRYFLHTASMIGHAGLTGHLIEHGADVHSLNDAGGTLLHSAAAGGLALHADLLLQDGFDPDATNRYGLTPLFLAAMEGHPEAVQTLVAAGAIVGQEDPAGKNAADHAVDFGHEEVVRLLQRYGVQPNPEKRTTLRGAYLGLPLPGTEPVLFAPGVVSSVHYDHSAPIFSADGREVYWSPVYTTRGDYILFMKQIDGRWSAPQVAPFCEVGGTYMYPTLSKDGTRLFFTSDRPVSVGNADQDMNIWFVEREGEGWSAPQLVGFEGGNAYGLSISDEGTLYFMADYEGGEGSTDLYRSRLVDGRYTPPENLGPNVNSAFYEDEPFIAPDENYLLFASLRPGETGDGRIYLSRQHDDASWAPPVNIASRLNMNGDLRFPHVSPDGRVLFFGSNQNGNWDLYWVSASVLAELIEGSPQE